MFPTSVLRCSRLLFCVSLKARWSWPACSSSWWSCPPSLSGGPRLRLFMSTFKSARARCKQRLRKSALTGDFNRISVLLFLLKDIYPGQWSSPAPGTSWCSPGRSSPGAASGWRCTGLAGCERARGPRPHQLPVSAPEMTRWPQPWCRSLLRIPGYHGDKEKGQRSEVIFFLGRAACVRWRADDPRGFSFPSYSEETRSLTRTSQNLHPDLGSPPCPKAGSGGGARGSAPWVRSGPCGRVRRAALCAWVCVWSHGSGLPTRPPWSPHTPGWVMRGTADTRQQNPGTGTRPRWYFSLHFYFQHLWRRLGCWSAGQRPQIGHTIYQRHQKQGTNYLKTLSFCKRKKQIWIFFFTFVILSP